jgi:hypothetical protein
MTIQRVRVADCDRSTDNRGNFTSSAYNYVIMEDDESNVDNGVWFDTEAEAVRYIADNE